MKAIIATAIYIGLIVFFARLMAFCSRNDRDDDYYV